MPVKTSRAMAANSLFHTHINGIRFPIIAVANALHIRMDRPGNCPARLCRNSFQILELASWVGSGRSAPDQGAKLANPCQRRRPSGSRHRIPFLNRDTFTMTTTITSTTVKN